MCFLSSIICLANLSPPVISSLKNALVKYNLIPSNLQDTSCRRCLYVLAWLLIVQKAGKLK